MGSQGYLNPLLARRKKTPEEWPIPKTDPFSVRLSLPIYSERMIFPVSASTYTLQKSGHDSLAAGSPVQSLA